MIIKRNYQFLLDKEKDKIDSRLRFRVRWYGNIVAFSLGIRISNKNWSPETQRCKNNTFHSSKKVPASAINREIQHFTNTAENIFARHENTQTIPTKNQFKTQFNQQIGLRYSSSQKQNNNPTINQILDQFTSTVGKLNLWTTTTNNKFKTLKKDLTQFNPNLSINDITDDTLQQFTLYLITKQLKNTTIMKKIIHLKYCLKWASSKNLYNGNAHLTFKPKLKGANHDHKEIIHLTWEELTTIYNLDLSNNTHLDQTRDIFCLTCFTGLRFSDVNKLQKNDIHPNHIAIVTQKTSDPLKIELNKYSQSILNKYTNTQLPNNAALPQIPIGKYNTNIRQLAKHANINQPQKEVYFIGNTRHENTQPKHELLTSHCGRRTFITIALYLGIPTDVIMKWTGHANHTSMKPYIKIIDQLKTNEMNKFNTL